MNVDRDSCRAWRTRYCRAGFFLFRTQRPERAPSIDRQTAAKSTAEETSRAHPRRSGARVGEPPKERGRLGQGGADQAPRELRDRDSADAAKKSSGKSAGSASARTSSTASSRSSSSATRSSAGARATSAVAKRRSPTASRSSRSCVGEERRRLEQMAGMSAQDAKNELIRRMEEEAQADAANRIREIREIGQAERRARSEEDRRARHPAHRRRAHGGDDGLGGRACRTTR